MTAFGRLADAPHCQPEGRVEQDEVGERDDDQGAVDQWRVAAEEGAENGHVVDQGNDQRRERIQPGRPKHARGAEQRSQQERGAAERQQIDRDARDDHVGAKAQDGAAEDDARGHARAHRADDADRHARGQMGDIDRGEGADQHEAFERDVEDGRPHAEQTAHGGEHDGRGYAHHGAQHVRVDDAAHPPISRSPRDGRSARAQPRPGVPLET